MAMGLDVRRLAAVDMHGLEGTRLRAGIITTEFLIGALGGPVLALAVLAQGPGPVGTLFGLWVLGVSLNYVPLAIYAVYFLRTGRHREELASADIRAELKHYTVAQVWVFVPLALVFFALRPPS